MVQSHEGGIGTVEECKLKPGLGAQIGETIFIENLGLKPRRSTTALLLNMSIVYEIYAKM
ncbi:MAG: hypothetical protein DWQ53_21565 [Microcystis flos-aquae DF17]|jgi:hypothetical protein|uniref:hypothetical protein n=1 Tax=Microcystis sp. LE19-41.2A TaxID=3016427 RepID=UPI000E3A0FFF|nr:hypothetical protein [Microcystis sp. LE19-41.2A]MCZ8048852.1 hypothetical protein [Microcystis sp. LE19-41.2A]MDJ0672536.1 hypothetical protein [Microcystis sp. M53598_WE2]REJ40646.1 MAG: hypothetical protein DWQ53_21565 [Microcystis flos-aquae DF17]